MGVLRIKKSAKLPCTKSPGEGKDPSVPGTAHCPLHCPLQLQGVERTEKTPPKMTFPSALKAEGGVTHPASPPSRLCLHVSSAFICCWLLFRVAAAFPSFPSSNFWINGRHCSIRGKEQVPWMLLVTHLWPCLLPPEGLLSSTHALGTGRRGAWAHDIMSPNRNPPTLEQL